jgi:transposase
MASKEKEKLRHQQEKEEEQYLIKRKRIRALNKEWRLQEAEQKKQQKEEDRVAKEAARQLQNDIENTKSSNKKASKSSTVQNIAAADPPAPKVVGKVPTTSNRSGRQIRLPQRFRGL